jgi:hypothetical protein
MAHEHITVVLPIYSFSCVSDTYLMCPDSEVLSYTHASPGSEQQGFAYQFIGPLLYNPAGRRYPGDI